MYFNHILSVKPHVTTWKVSTRDSKNVCDQNYSVTITTIFKLSIIFDGNNFQKLSLHVPSFPLVGLFGSVSLRQSLVVCFVHSVPRSVSKAPFCGAVNGTSPSSPACTVSRPVTILYFIETILSRWLTCQHCFVSAGTTNLFERLCW